jgi:hypothetical protein
VALARKRLHLPLDAADRRLDDFVVGGVGVAAQRLGSLTQLELVVRVVPVELLLLRHQHALAAEQMIRPVQVRIAHPDAVAEDHRVGMHPDVPAAPRADVRHAAVPQVLVRGREVAPLVRHVVRMQPAVADAARCPAARHQLEAARRHLVLELVGARAFQQHALEQRERLGLAGLSVLGVVERIELLAHRCLLAPFTRRL